MVPPEQLRWYAESLSLEGATVLDVGANVGELSAFFWSQVGPTGRVISVEPLRSNVVAIAARIAAVGATNWRIEACAVSDHDGEVALVTGYEGGAWNSVVAGHGLVRVPARRLHELAPEATPEATVVKLDIEGHEYAVLDDALPRMPGVRAWALELHMVPGRPLGEVLAQLRAHDYSLCIAGRAAGDPRGPWRSVEVPAALEWSMIPAMPRPSGGPAIEGLKTIHVIAARAG